MISSSDSERKGKIEDIDPFVLGDEFNTIERTGSHSLPNNSSDTSGIDDQSSRTMTNQPNNQTGGNTGNRLTDNPDSGSKTTGYRVQTGLFNDESEAYRYAENVRSKIELNVYVIYKAPFFHVLAGDFTTENEAERYVNILKGKGFRNALWIITTINTR